MQSISSKDRLILKNIHENENELVVFTFEAHDTQVDVELDNGWNPFSPTLDIHHYSQEAFWQKPFEHIYIYK